MTTDLDERCPDCGHASHSTLPFCPNMASDNECACKRKSDPLDELDALRAAATPGEWKQEGVAVRVNITDHIATTRLHADAAFIVAACNNIGPLIERVREAEKRAEDAQHHIAYHLSDYRLNSEPTGDLAVDMAAYATRLTARAEVAEARLATLEAGMRALADEMETSTGTHLTVVDGKTKKVPLFLGPVVVARIRALLTKGGE